MESMFASISRDELWHFRHSGHSVTGALMERRSGGGQARTSGGPSQPFIDASDVISDSTLSARLSQLVREAAEEASRAMHLLTFEGPARVRMVCEARMAGAASAESGLSTEVRSLLTVTVPYAGAPLSIVTTAARAIVDVERMLTLAADVPRQTVDHDDPLLWTGGSAAVLFHEAAGHPAEHGHARLSWPSWLRVRDEPDFDGPGAVHSDDLGRPARSADLLDGEMPSAMRRSSFRDIPIRRMTTVVARCDDAPFDLPERRVEIQLVAGGSYEPLTELVSIHVSVADLVTASGRIRLTPFTLRASRAEIASGLSGARGAPLYYPGVVCSREGQELVVGCAAPVVLTRGFGG